MKSIDPRIARLLTLGRNALAAPPGRGRRAVALAMGFCCHLVFAAAIASMVYGMFFGLTMARGAVSHPWSLLTNLLLLIQFPLLHSLLLTRGGLKALAYLVPGPYGRPLGTTTYAIVASVQLLLAFWLWTPSGVVWWRAEGTALIVCSTAYGAAWAVLGKAILDAGADVQSGALGWLSLLADKAPVFPGLPTLGLFKIVRQPIYLAFAATLWTVPVWTPDQFALAVAWSLYCVAAPVLKERRFLNQYGRDFEQYRERVPYMVPGLGRSRTARASKE
ncbi:MAG: isoprenylcysteine carboxylmethyltransferase family protein [Pseudomonadota bacterium]